MGWVEWHLNYGSVQYLLILKVQVQVTVTHGDPMSCTGMNVLVHNYYSVTGYNGTTVFFNSITLRSVHVMYCLNLHVESESH